MKNKFKKLDFSIYQFQIMRFLITFLNYQKQDLNNLF